MAGDKSINKAARYFIASAALLITGYPPSVVPVFAQLQSQTPSVTAAFDRDSVMMGDQFHMVVTVEKDIMQVVGFPGFDGSGEAAPGATANDGPMEIAPGVELLAEFPVDTLSVDGRRHSIAKRYLLTIWEAGSYNLGRFPALYADKNVVDTLYSPDSLRIVVGGFDIDLENDKPYDIKAPLRVPMRPGEISGWLALGLLGLAVLVVAIWLLVKYRSRIPLLGGEKPTVPPHVEAIRRLEALRHQKLPQNGKHKQYYSGITDILRVYIERRWGIGAMEMTSGEIIEAADVPRSAGDIDAKRFEDLAELLRTADLVKFAKLVPDEAEVDRAYFNAYYFVEETKAAVEGRAEESEKDI